MESSNAINVPSTSQADVLTNDSDREDDSEQLHDDIEKIRQALASETEEDSDDHDGDIDEDFSDDEQTQADEHMNVDSEPQLDLASDKLPTNSRTCLAWNRAYQDVILETLKRIEHALSLNRKKQQEVKENNFKDKKTTSESSKLNHNIYCIPYFKDINGMIPPANDDTLSKKAENEDMGLAFHSYTWKGCNKRQLTKSVYEDLKVKRMKVHLKEKEKLVAQLPPSHTAEENNDIKNAMDVLDQEIQAINLLPCKEIYGDHRDSALMNSIDWMKISCTDFSGKPSAMECQLAWQNSQAPTIHHGSWTAQDTKKLAALSLDKELTWHQIAEHFPNRTVLQCVRHYNVKIEPTFEHSKLAWSPEEDSLLMEAVDASTEGDCILWELVGEAMIGRTRQQCYNRWITIKKRINRGKWTVKEDMNLISAVNWYSASRWPDISEYVTGRSPYQCKQRWTQVWQNDTLQNWTYQEDRELWLSVKPGINVDWDEIKLKCNSRTAQQCHMRYMKLQQWDKHDKYYMQSLPRRYLGSAKEKNSKSFYERWSKSMYECSRADERLNHMKLRRSLEGGLTTPIRDIVEDVVNLEKSKNKDLEYRLQSYQLQLFQVMAANRKRARKSASIEENELIVQDIQKGIIIPHPPVVDALEIDKLSNQKTMMKRLVQSQMVEVERDWQRFAREGTSAKLKSFIEDRSLSRNSELKETRNISFNLLSLQSERMDDPDHTTQIRKFAEYDSKSKETTKAKKEKEKLRKIERDIAFKLRPTVTKKSAGRPRVHLLAGHGDDWEPTPDMIDMVIQLLLNAFNVDIPGCWAICNALMQPPDHSEPPTDTNTSNCFSASDMRTNNTEPETKVIRAISTQGVIGGVSTQVINSESDGDIIVQKPKQQTEYTQWNEANQRQIFEENPHVRDEIDLIMRLKAKKSQKTVATSNVPTGCEIGPIKKLAYKGKDAKVYNIPTLPPTLATLEGFRRLLGLRIDLLKCGGRFCKSAVIGEGPTTDKILSIRRLHDYQMLKSRMKALFMWPAILSSIPVPRKAEESFPIKYQKGKARLFGRTAKARKHTNVSLEAKEARFEIMRKAREAKKQMKLDGTQVPKSQRRQKNSVEPSRVSSRQRTPKVGNDYV